MKVLLDEHLSPQIAVELRRRGHDVVSVVERRDLLRATDDRVWAAAHGERRAIVTRDVRDYVRLAGREMAGGLGHPGVVLLNHRQVTRGGRDIGRLVAALDALLSAYPDDDGVAGRITWVPD